MEKTKNYEYSEKETSDNDVQPIMPPDISIISESQLYVTPYNNPYCAPIIQGQPINPRNQLDKMLSIEDLNVPEINNLMESEVFQLLMDSAIKSKSLEPIKPNGFEKQPLAKFADQIFKIPGYFFEPREKIIGHECYNLEQAEILVQMLFSHEHDVASYDSHKNMIYLMRMPCAGHKKIQGCTIFAVGKPIGISNNRESFENIFEMENVDMCGGDITAKPANVMEESRNHVLKDLKEFGDGASHPWGHQKGTWYKNWLKSAPLKPFGGTNLFLYGELVGPVSIIKKEMVFHEEPNKTLEDHVFKVCDWGMPGGDQTRERCDSIEDAEAIIRQKLHTKFDAAEYRSDLKMIFFKRIPGAKKPVRLKGAAVYQIGKAIGSPKDAKSKENIFEMENMDMCGGDHKNQPGSGIVDSRVCVLKNLKEFGDAASSPWGYQKGTWYKKWPDSAPFRELAKCNLYVFGLSIGKPNSSTECIIKKEMGFHEEPNKTLEDHVFKVCDWGMPGGDQTRERCDSIEDAEAIIRQKLHTKFDAAEYRSDLKMIFFKRIPGAKKPVRLKGAAVYQIGKAIGSPKDAKSKENIFEMENMDMCGGDHKNQPGSGIVDSRVCVLKNLKEFGDAASSPWGYQKGTWYKKWPDSAPFRELAKCNLYVFGLSIGKPNSSTESKKQR